MNAPSPAPARLDLKGKTVFHVEDDKEVREALARWLQMHGAEVYSESEVPAAISRLEFLEAKLDVVVTDWNLFGRKGKEVVEVAQKFGVPVMVLSGDPYDVKGHVSCPIVAKGDFTALTATLRKLLDGAEESRS